MSEKRATTIEEQIEKLKERGMLIENEEKAKELLLNVGYYRLGFYWFPFEKTYPHINDERKHDFCDGTTFNTVWIIYTFDTELRYMLMNYLNKIEISFRTYLTYFVSNYYKKSPTWFVDPSIVNRSFAKNFELSVYNSLRKQVKCIQHHHKKYINDKYAPAWKTIEFMTFGAVVPLWEAIKDKEVKRKVAEHYGVTNLKVFKNYIRLVVILRNICAHERAIFDWSSDTAILSSKNVKIVGQEYHNLEGAFKVVSYLLEAISAEERARFETQLYALLKKFSTNEKVCETLKKTTGFDF